MEPKEGRSCKWSWHLLKVAQHPAHDLGVHFELCCQLVLLDPLPPSERIQCDHSQPCELGLQGPCSAQITFGALQTQRAADAH